MTLKPLGFDFALMSEFSTRAPWAVPEAEWLPEVERELGERDGFYRRQVARQAMTQADADRHIGLLAAVRDDLAFAAGGAGEPGSDFTWDAKVRELRREIQLRRNRWPRRISAPADPLDAGAAARRMEALEAVHHHYWIGLFAADDEFAGEAGGFPPPHFIPSDANVGRIRALHWRIWDWERRALAGGDPAARPEMAAFYAAIDAGEPEALGYWTHYRFCAERCGFAEPQKAAA